MIQYAQWTRSDFKAIVRREIMDTNTRWLQDGELTQYLDNWLYDLQQEYEFIWAINTLTITSTTTDTLVIPLTTFTPSMMRNEAVYYNGFRLAGRFLQDLEVGNPIWRNGAAIGTASLDTPRVAVMYPDSQNILIWPQPPAPAGTSSNVFVFEYPVFSTFSGTMADTNAFTCGLPFWVQWSAKSYICAKFFQRPGPLNDRNKSMRYWAQWQRAKQRIKKIWDGYLPERVHRLQPGMHYEWDILIPVPAWNVGTATATGT